MTVKLIFNADDFARSTGINRGIIKAHQDGLITTTTAMMNLKNAPQALMAAQEECPKLGFGVHLNITFGAPLSPPDQVSSLLNPDGLFRDVRSLMSSPETIKYNEVESEWRRQIKHFLATGIPLDHLDSHHHSAVTTPELFNILLDLGTEHGCGIRNPRPLDADAVDMHTRYTDSVIRFVLQDAVRLMDQRSIKYPDYFLASFFGENATRRHLASLMQDLKAGTYEIMCHPGFPDSNLDRESSYSSLRKQELDILTDPEIKQLVRENEIRLHTYRSAWEA